jgi:hypothetical protein
MVDRREFPRVPGKFKEAEDAVHQVLREAEIISSPSLPQETSMPTSLPETDPSAE